MNCSTLLGTEYDLAAAYYNVDAARAVGTWPLHPPAPGTGCGVRGGVRDQRSGAERTHRHDQRHACWPHAKSANAPASMTSR